MDERGNGGERIIIPPPPEVEIPDYISEGSEPEPNEDNFDLRPRVARTVNFEEELGLRFDTPRPQPAVAAYHHPPTQEQVAALVRQIVERQYRNELHYQYILQKEREKLVRNFLHQLPQVIIDQETSKENLDCAICMNQFLPDDIIKCLPCHETHRFHGRCIYEWLRLPNRNCPICRSKVPLVRPSTTIN